VDTKTVPILFADTLRRHFNVNAFTKDWIEDLKRELSNTHRDVQFRSELADAILKDTITPAQYEHLTDEDFDTQEDLNKWLRSVWQDLYGDLPISSS